MSSSNLTVSTALSGADVVSPLKSPLRRTKRSKTDLDQSPSTSARSSTGSFEVQNGSPSLANAKHKVGGLFKRKKKPDNDLGGLSGGSTTSLDKMTYSRSREDDSNGDLIQFDGESDYSDGGRTNPRVNINQQPTNGALPLSPARNTMSPNFSDPALGRTSTLPSVVEPHGGMDHLSNMPQDQNQNSIDLNRRPSTSYSPSQRIDRKTRPSRGGSLGQDSLQPARINTNPDISSNYLSAGGPQTTVTPPTPIDEQTGSAANRRSRGLSLSNANTPSKLSQTMTVPATPTNEGQQSSQQNSPNTQNQAATGFFSSIIGVAQNAATSISTLANTAIKNQQDGRLRSGSDNSTDNMGSTNGTQQSAPPANGTGSADEQSEPKKKLAVETLGMGELSLNSLGIVPSPAPDTTVGAMSAMSAPDTVNTRRRAVTTDSTPQDVSRAEMEALANREGLMGTPSALSQGRTPLAEDIPLNIAPAPVRTGDGLDGADPPQFSGRRSGSLRSFNLEKGRTRGESAASAALSQISASVRKITGFAVASKKRNRDFHALFKSVPEDDYLIEDYGAALQKEILLQGRFYVSEGHICFYSNIFGWINTLVISFDEVVAIEKKTTAMVFPNAIVVQTLHSRNIFASFINRDATFDLLHAIWKISHPNLVSSPTGIRLNDGSDDKLDDEDGDRSDDEGSGESDEYDEDEDYTGDEEEDEKVETAKGATPEKLGDSKEISRKASNMALAKSAAADAPPGEKDYPGPATHEPTSCGDEGAHYDRPLCDEILAAPLGKIYSLLFGPASFKYLSRFYAEDQKLFEISIPSNGEFADIEGKKTRTVTYIRPLNNGIGPKQTKCICTEVLEVDDLENCVTAIVSTQTPDVPSGNAFVVKTRYCLTWAPFNQTRLVMNCTIEWTGKSWLKGPIEKGASDGQTSYCAALLASLRKEIEPAAAGGRKGGKKGRRKRGDTNSAAPTTGSAPKPSASSAPSNQGPVMAILSGAFNIIKPLLPNAEANPHTLLLYILILTLSLLLIKRSPVTVVQDASQLQSVGGDKTPDMQRLWRREETEMWDWIEDRVGVQPKGGEFRRELEEVVDVLEGRLVGLKRELDRAKSQED
ncbi:hypothetical protein BJ508DRAFT_414149 [Ascobolus immersus RN42]|uniref:VASt domain-containing protein n=1 Tax=Ascobolus immersus RN42 TaxID=1160509 RepID=A0A3N4I878_ASCIM|nr:hypothetical protein BJ508DRAFT_414149 [Ascobolus immersus RN42]